jgi:hypothetical protein
MVTKPYLVRQRLYHVMHLFSPRIGYPTTGTLFTGELHAAVGGRSSVVAVSWVWGRKEDRLAPLDL